MEIRRDHLEPEFFYHIYNRGINSEDVYKNKDNYLYFLKKAKEFLLPVADMYAYCLMKNHFHLLVRIKPEVELNPNSAIEKKEYFSILISNCVAVEKNKR